MFKCLAALAIVATASPAFAVSDTTLKARAHSSAKGSSTSRAGTIDGRDLQRSMANDGTTGPTGSAVPPSPVTPISL